MKRTIKAFALAVFALAALQGCISINNNKLKNLTAEQQQKVVRPTRPLDQLTRCDSIYLVNDNDVRAFLQDKDLAIVHGYLTWCKSKMCISPALALEKLQGTGLPFLMIAGDLSSTAGYNANYPFMTIDPEYYQTGNYSKSIQRMYQSLGCGETWWQLYHLFRRGEFIGSAETVEDVMKLCGAGTKRFSFEIK